MTHLTRPRVGANPFVTEPTEEAPLFAAHEGLTPELRMGALIEFHSRRNHKADVRMALMVGRMRAERRADHVARVTRLTRGF